MRVYLELKEDEDFRNYVKDLIKSQAKSIAREAIADEIKNAIINKTKSMTDGDSFHRLLRNTIRSILLDDWHVREIFIKILKEELENILPNYLERIDVEFKAAQIAKKAIRTMTDQLVNKLNINEKD